MQDANPLASRAFSVARGRARRIYVPSKQNDAELCDVADAAARAAKCAEERKGTPLSDLLDELRALIRLVHCVAMRTYKPSHPEDVVLIVAALIYAASPIDLIPDALPGGLIDDAAVLALVLKIVREEVEAFTEWEESRAGLIATERTSLPAA